ncbi:MAG: hypothetical protein AAGK77_14425 [Pseudomonadota bacterium]
MPLHILVVLVVFGIAGITLALHLLGLSRTAPFADGTARAAWLRAYPDDEILSIQITREGHVARITTTQGKGILWQMGTHDCARRLTGQETLTCKAGGAVLHLNDYAAPRVRLPLSSSEQTEWQTWIVSS